MKAYVPQHIRIQETRRKCLRFSFFIILVVLSVAGVIYGIFFNPKLLVANITVSGFDQSLATQLQDTLRAKKILKGLVPSNNLLFVEKDDFASFSNSYPEIKSIVMSKDYKNTNLSFDITTRKPGGVWCGEGEGCFIFDTDGVIYAKQEASIASSSLGLVIEDSNRFSTLLSTVEGKEMPVRNILDAVVAPETILTFKNFLTFFEGVGTPIKTIIRRGGNTSTALFETKYGGVFLIDSGRGFEETKRELTAIKDKLNFKDILYVDVRTPGRVYYK
ncbi:MAG: hypothetical protein HZA36_03285 [Parcubacteria group bacterium]|nr:hypothetical protein [Parcubacteria group bacterium]